MNSSTHAASGACLCGKIAFKAQLKPGAGACHCGMCRKWSGGPLMSVFAVGDVEFTGTEHIRSFRSSEWAERAFCEHCGSNLYYRVLPNPKMPEGEYILSAGLVEDQSTLTFDHEVFVDQAPGWYQFTAEDNRQRMTEAEVMAMFAPEN